MTELRAFILDVGWGDSILLESTDDNGQQHFAIVDSNDTPKNQFTLNFLRRRLQTLGIDYKNNKPFLEFVLLTHAHTDHGQGLKAIMQEFGTKNFWYSKSSRWGSMGYLLNFAKRSSNVQHHQAIDDQCVLPNFGNVILDVLWPYENHDHNTADENNNSVVLTLKLENHVFLLSGDAEEEVWDKIASDIPSETIFFKVPHHGSVNGSLDGQHQPTWLNNCPTNASLGISCHIGRFGHPHDEVIQLFESSHPSLYQRTDRDFHLEYVTNGHSLTKRYHK